MNKKEKILIEACKLFAEKGYKKTTIAEICKAAKVNIASVNYYFNSKKNIYREVFKYAYSIAEQKAPIISIPTQKISSEEKLFLFIKTLIRRNYSDGEEKYLQMLFLHESSEPTDICRNFLNNIRAKYRQVLYDILIEIVDEKDDEKFPLIAYSIISQCLFLRFNPIAKASIFKKYKKEKLIELLSNHIYKFSINAIRYYNL